MKCAVFFTVTKRRWIRTVTLSSIFVRPAPCAVNEKSRPTPASVIPKTRASTDAPPLSSKM